ncbi:hypothetical protein KGA66_01575 [Actinocrinis puniceicyclus]|uniref:Uncharacterized protein n=1 Tax=Actinocrinis puniceicyclus TaxID=977794 RepID=A0A8J8BCF3_9ACTN|nr:DUF5691 domain-containing protein [Actinocrinis puniceicyclus]MBS2961719.1 hypothetical protein [Actinocrinis puniceicyclus]
MTVPDVMDDWAHLVSTALVGTDRRPLPAAGPGPGADPAAQLLARAALAGLARRVGRPPERFEGALPQPAPPDPRPALPQAAARRLRTILDSYPKYLPEWLAAVRRAGFRLPAAYLPPLLDIGRTNMLIRADLAAVLAEPGRWLAAASGNWRYLLREARAEARPEDWQGADPDARVCYVAGLYLSDPQAARRLIRQDWAAQRAAVKLGLLALVSRYPDPDDVSFVQGLLKDPSKQVRDEATLLAGGLERRSAKPPPPDFTAEVARLLAANRGVGRDLHNFVMTRSGEPWPHDGALLLIDALAERGGRAAKAAWSDWIAEQVQTAVADNAPLTVRDRVAGLVADQAVAAALEGAAPRVDFAAMLALLDFRRDMLAELRLS